MFAGLSNDTINIIGTPVGVGVVVDGRAGLDDIDVNSDVIGTATITFAASQDLASLEIFAGGTAVLAAGGAKFITTDAIALTNNGTLDLNDNDLIVDYTGASQLGAIQSLIRVCAKRRRVDRRGHHQHRRQKRQPEEHDARA